MSRGIILYQSKYGATKKYVDCIAGLQFLKKNIGQLTGKQIAVFAVGASPYEEKAI